MSKRAKAARPRSTTGGGLRGYISHHLSTLRQSLGRLWGDRLQSALTATVVAIAISLPAALYLTVENIAQLAPPLKQPARLSVYAEVGSSSAQLQALRSQLEARPEQVGLSYTSPQQALQELSSAASFAGALDGLPSNPLPPLFELSIQLEDLAAGRVSPSAELEERLEVLRAELAALPGVAEVELDTLWLQRLHALLRLARQLLAAGALVLLLGVVVVIGNSVKMAIDHRREEIVVIKWVGGTDAYVRRPFLYAGALYGLLGALLALLALLLLTAVINHTAQELASLYQSQFQLRGPQWREALFLLGASALVGVLSAYLAVSGQLRAITPQ